MIETLKDEYSQLKVWILETVGVDTWENLKGQHIRVKDNGLGSTVDEIGNLMEEKWFNIREFFENV